MEMILKGLVILLIGVLGNQNVDGVTTAFPEICRVMALYRECSDVTFRIACPGQCSPSQGQGCNGMDYDPSRGYCYQASQTHTSIWPYAVEFCKAYGASLALLKNAADAEVAKSIVTASGSTSREFHVGCLNVATGQDWVWLDNTVEQASDKNWDSSYPKVSSNKPNCMWLYKQSNYKQRNDECNYNYGYICRIDPFGNSTTT